MKKKGFTLIELLAVIIILAIVALVATPIILDVVADSRNSVGLSEAKSIYGGINSYCATSKSRYELTGKEDICADGVTKEEVSSMVNLGNAEVLFVKYKDGKVIRLVVKSNGKIYELQNDGTFKVIDEYVPDQTAPVIAKTAYYDKAGKITDYLDVDFGENEGTYECEKELKDLTEATNKVKCTAESEYGVTTEQEVTFIANVLKTSSSVSKSDTTWLGSSIKRNQVKAIYTVDHKNIPEGATSWDISNRNNKSIMAWYGEPDENGLYDLYIGQNGGVMAGSGYYLFAEFNKLKNIDLSNLDTSKVTNMNRMFFFSNATMLELSNFDTSKVTNMSGMFWKSEATEIKFGDKFDTSKVTDMTSMFGYSKATMLDLNDFNTSNVTNMSDMFYSNQAKTLNLSSFNTSNVTDMTNMFGSSRATSLDLSSFDTSKVTIMLGMFSYSQAISLDLSSFDTGKVANMNSMFSGSRAKEIKFGTNFSTSKVGGMSSMFSNSQATSLDLSNFDTSNVKNMSSMFRDINVTSLDLSNFDTHNVTDMSWMFTGSSGTNLDLSSFDTGNVTNMSYMFYQSAIKSIDLSSFNTSNVTNMSYMFNGSRATTGYARTQEDADKFNASSNKPSALNFIVKPAS